MSASDNPYQHYSQPHVSDDNDDLINPDTGMFFLFYSSRRQFAPALLLISLSPLTANMQQHP